MRLDTVTLLTVLPISCLSQSVKEVTSSSGRLGTFGSTGVSGLGAIKARSFWIYSLPVSMLRKVQSLYTCSYCSSTSSTWVPSTSTGTAVPKKVSMKGFFMATSLLEL